MVDRLPYRPGLENAPLVECACETISADSRMRVVIWNRSDRTTTVPAHSPVARVCVDYLGHLVTREGLKMDPKKLEAVGKVDPTSINTLEKVRSFLGLCSY